jgi:hypothetical protein
MDIELLITAFFNRIRHPGEASLSTALKKKDRQCRWYINSLKIRRELEGIIQEISHTFLKTHCLSNV